MSKIKVSLIEDTSETDVEENQESDKPMEPVLSDEPPPPLNEKPKRIRKKPETTNTTTRSTTARPGPARA